MVGLPRISELQNIDDATGSPDAYFRDFDDLTSNHPRALEFWTARERELSELDPEAWDFLKNKIRPYLTVRDVTRGWPKLFETLNEARGYRYLKTIGCSGVRFIPGGRRKTPDLEAKFVDVRILCEVKTINISDEEARSRVSNLKVSRGKIDLTPGFFRKIGKDIEKAKSQMDAYDARPNAKRIIYFVVNFDDLLGDCKERFFGQLDRHLLENRLPGIEFVFHNQKTPLYKPVKMAAAVVVNE